MQQVPSDAIPQHVYPYYAEVSQNECETYGWISEINSPISLGSNLHDESDLMSYVTFGHIQI